MKSISIGYYWFLVLLVSCNNTASISNNVLKETDNSSKTIANNNDTAFENHIIDTIFSLDEIQQENKQLDSITDHKKGIAFMVNKLPETKGEYEIYVGYNGAERFETYHIFYFDSITSQITIMAAASGDRVSLDEWRKKKL